MNVVAASLGICGACKTVVTVTGMPMDGMNAKWTCDNCGKELGQTDFGYEEVSPGEFKKTKWVNEQKQWSDEKTSGFQIGQFFVIGYVPARTFF